MIEKKTEQLSAEDIRNAKAEDTAYTINHSLYCTLTDFINPPINAATDGWLRWLIPGCGHDHSHDAASSQHVHEPDAKHVPSKIDVLKKDFLSKPVAAKKFDALRVNFNKPAPVVHTASCTHEHAHNPPGATKWERVKNSFKHSFSKDRFIQYAKGEFIGDFGAVPLTIGVQRFFPSVISGLRKMCEPVMRPVFKWGVEKDAKKWAKKNGVASDSQEFKDHVHKVYEYEMRHFPQAVLWTGFSLGLNTAYQMHADKSPMAFNRKLMLKSSSVLSGVLVTAGVVVAARALVPEKMHSFDSWTSRKAILPATKAVGGLFGVRRKDVETMMQNQPWKDRAASDDGLDVGR